MEMKLSRKLRERANNRNTDEQLNDSDKEDSDEQSDSDKSETGSNISMDQPRNQPRNHRKSTGGLLPRKQLAVCRGSFHKRVRETSGDSGPVMNKLTKTDFMNYGRLDKFYVLKFIFAQRSKPRMTKND